MSGEKVFNSEREKREYIDNTIKDIHGAIDGIKHSITVEETDKLSHLVATIIARILEEELKDFDTEDFDKND